MDRKDFIKKSLAAGVIGVASPGILKAAMVNVRHSDYDKLMEPIGFNHIPNKENKTMNTVLHKAESRGHANHGWLDSHHTFSFANYYNPERVHFGVLRVLNDDIVAPAKGFGTHPHDNMEIISIPLKGDLEHQDSMGNVTVIKEGDVQVMSAGTGVSHSEYNKNDDEEVRFLQIWVFPNKKKVEPRYDQISIREIEKKNEFYQVLSPNADDQGVWIHQDAWFHLGQFDAKQKQSYTLRNKDNGLYIFVLEGSIVVEGQEMDSRDGFGIWDIEEVNFEFVSKSRVLVMEVPMSV